MLDGLSKPEQIADRCKELRYEAAAISDHGSIAGVPSFIKECNKRKIKPIAGEEFYLCAQDATLREPANAGLSHLVVLAKNERGWKNLMRASSASYRPEHSYRKPRLDLTRLASFSEGQFIVFSGHMGSDLANAVFEEPKLAYRARSTEEAKALAGKGWTTRVLDVIDRYLALFGTGNFFVEIQQIDRDNLPASAVVAEGLRWAAKKRGVPRIATADSHYCRPEDAADQRVLLATALDTTLKEVERKIEAGEDVSLGTFFKSNKYHIPSLDEMRELHTQDELENTVKIAELCEEYKVGGQPMIPKFEGLEPQESDQRLQKLCAIGWKQKIDGVISHEKQKPYADEIRKELTVLFGAGLSSYFLIVQDYIAYARNVLKCRPGRGRGSGAGCLVSYLTGITGVDPVETELYFERFYNAGRNTPGRTALPDIDTDFPITRREEVIEYIRSKYGRDKVCQMATFSRMQGRGALKDVLRVHERLSFEEMNRVTSFVPDEAEIADQLQEAREETGEASIILWALQNNANDLAEWAVLKEDGSIDGPLGVDFAQAIRLEGTRRGMSRHASGLIICSEVLADICPMVWDKSTEEMIVGVDMKTAEDIGLVKFDILGLASLSKIDTATSLITSGRTQ